MTQNPNNPQLPAVSTAQIPENIRRVLNKLQQSERSILENYYSRSVTLSQFIGPIPPPEMLEAYAKVVPTAPERILAMAEKQSEHRIAMEAKVIAGRESKTALGQIFAFIIGVVAIVASAYCAVKGQPWVAGILGGSTVVSLTLAFITGQQKQAKELSQKRPE